MSAGSDNFQNSLQLLQGPLQPDTAQSEMQTKLAVPQVITGMLDMHVVVQADHPKAFTLGHPVLTATVTSP